MGQKVDPRGLRLGIVRDSESIWYAGKNYHALLLEDFNIRKFLQKKLKRSSVSSIQIKRRAKQLEIDIYSGRPGLIIGKGGSEVEVLKKELESMVKKNIQVNIHEQKKPDLSAEIIGEGMVMQLEKRMPFRQVMKQAVNRSLKAGAKGIRVCCAGRLGGAEIARTEWYREGRVPLHTLRSDIDYAKKEAHTTYGIIGVKVWIYKGDILDQKSAFDDFDSHFDVLDKEEHENVTA